MTISQLVPFARSAGGVASVALLVGACGNVGGRILSGWLSDFAGALDDASHHGSRVRDSRWPSLFVFREQLTLLYILLAAVYWCYGTQPLGVCIDDGGSLRHEEPRVELRCPVHRMGGGGIIGPMIAGRVL